MALPAVLEVQIFYYLYIQLHILPTIFMEVKGVGMGMGVGDVLDSFIDVGYRFLFQVINMYMMH